MSRGKRKIAVLGSTGSIGQNALQVASHLPGRLEVTGIAACRSVELLAQQADASHCAWAHTAVPELKQKLASGISGTTRAVTGDLALCELVCGSEIDTVLCAIVGTAGLKPVLAAIRAGKTIALASKEIMVMAGELVTAEARKSGSRILPVDSEHSAIFQCLDNTVNSVDRLIITASGGPFWNQTGLDLSAVTPEQALAHPTWDMGNKITIDSATLMNKALEIIEAKWLFDVPSRRIEAVIHPQSVIHSMVEFSDGSILAQIGNPDMRLPIQYALTYPDRFPSLLEPMDFSKVLKLEFHPPDHERFPALRLARQALEAGGTVPAAFNAANEIAVESFCSGRISFTDIFRVVECALDVHANSSASSLEVILEADRAARDSAVKTVRRLIE